MNQKHYYQEPGERVAEFLHVDLKKGLSIQDAKERLEKFGYNRLKEGKKLSPFSMFFSQFNDFMVMVLVGAALISIYLGEMYDSLTIIAIVIINGILGFLQEFRAEKSIAALKELAAPTAKVIREGEETEVPATHIVPGDLLILEAGDRVAADGRLLSVTGLEAEESALTGESMPVKKYIEQINGEVPLGDCRNMVFMGTIITRGRGIAIVTATGMDTEMGKIAAMLQETVEEETPLQLRLKQLGKILVFLCLLICAIVMITGVLRGEPIHRMFLIGISLAVAAIPEGLPAIVTVALAIGVQRMIKRNALIRKLPAVETLGCATVICSDKTGTLTLNQMAVKEIYVDKREITVQFNTRTKQAEFICEGNQIQPQIDSSVKLALRIGAVCNNATLKRNRKKDFIAKFFNWQESQQNLIKEISGEPTEKAMVAVALMGKLDFLKDRAARIREIPFDSDRKRMTVVIRDEEGKLFAFTKGAPDVIIGLCGEYFSSNGIVSMNPALRLEIILQNEKMAKKALRVLGVAFRELPPVALQWTDEEIETGLTFVGLVGIIDPPRPEAKRAVEVCRRAGIKTVMITGDHKLTATAIAKELKMIKDESEVLTGIELDKLSDKELEKRVNYYGVYARVSPKHKLRIVRALKNKGHIVAMTGDGVNDAPAVKEADIGVAMGISGTDVTKEASAMILQDDNFATIVAAVEEGRAIYDNIRKFIRYLLGCNLGEVLTMFVSSLLWLPLPLLPIQILWVNLATDGLPAMALGVDKGDSDVMWRRPRSPQESVFSHGLWLKIILRGCIIGMSTVAAFIYTLSHGYTLIHAQTVVLATLVISQLIHVFECRSERLLIWEMSLFSNIYLIFAVCSSFFLLAAVIYLPFLQPIFKTVSLTMQDWQIVFSAAAWPLLISLGRKLLKFRTNGRIYIEK